MRNSQGKLFQDKFPLERLGKRTKISERKARPLSTKDSIHLIMRSSLAKGSMSFRNPLHYKKISELVQTFSRKKGIQILSFANVGNHLHFHIRITNRTLYKAWIRGLSSAIAMLVAKRDQLMALKKEKKSFWDFRPFTRVVRSLKAFYNMKDYVLVNQFEGAGMPRTQAELMIKGLTSG